MNYKISRRKVLRASLILSGALACGAYFTFRKSEIGVSTGEIKYSTNGILRADGSSACSVVVIGNESEAVMAHAFPENVLFLHREKRVTIENAVGKCIEELTGRGIEVARCEAAVNAGTKKGYDKLIGDLNKQGIKIRDAYLEEGKRRNVYYDIRKRKIESKYIKYFKS